MWKESRLLLLSALLFLFSACSSLVEDNAFDSEPSTDERFDDASVVAASKGLSHAAKGPGGLTVMTRNLYIGTDVGIVLSADSPEQLPVLAAQAFGTLLSTNFPERAQALAEEIAQARPHLVGIQEATVIRLQSPGDALSEVPTDAEDVLFDYLDILLQALEARGLDYRVAGSIRNADVELPMLTGTDPLTFDDVRVTDFDVILARHDVDVSRLVAANFQARLPLPSLGLSLPRGYVAVDATILNRTYRVVNTHLEPFALPIQMAQAQELLGSLEGETLPIVLLGDFNTPAPTGDTYQFLLSEGYLDVWARSVKPHGGAGHTCCQAADLRNPVSMLDERIDLILFKTNDERHGHGGLGAVFADVVGEEPQDRTASGLWPSDHAGVVATMRVPATIPQTVDHRYALAGEIDGVDSPSAPADR